MVLSFVFKTAHCPPFHHQYTTRYVGEQHWKDGAHLHKDRSPSEWVEQIVKTKAELHSKVLLTYGQLNSKNCADRAAQIGRSSRSWKVCIKEIFYWNVHWLQEGRDAFELNGPDMMMQQHRDSPHSMNGLYPTVYSNLWVYVAFLKLIRYEYF